MRRCAGDTWVDLAVIGNGSAGAAVVYEINRYLKANPSLDFRVLVYDAETEEEKAAKIPEYNMRVSFPYGYVEGLPEAAEAAIHWYDKVAFFSRHRDIRKKLPETQVALVDINHLVDLMERDLDPRIQIKYHAQVYDVDYIRDDRDNEFVELKIQYPFGDGKIFEATGRQRARAVVDASGAGSVVLDKFQGYRQESDVVCGVLGFKVMGAQIPDLQEVSLALDDSITHGAGAWAYHNGSELSPKFEAYLGEWFHKVNTDKKYEGKRIRSFIKGKSPKDFAGTISDVGISSISTYARAQHYISNLERQAEELFSALPAYAEMFMGSAVVPGSWFYKPSPVLQPVAKMAGRRYLLVGDAAGQATPYIGEGVRPGIDMGRKAAEILIEALRKDDLSESTLRRPYERFWWNNYGKYDIYSDLFRHFSSTCFDDGQWDDFFKGIDEKLTSEEFYEVLKSQYTSEIVFKMFNMKMAPHYFKYQARHIYNFVFDKLTLREAASWLV